MDSTSEEEVVMIPPDSNSDTDKVKSNTTNIPVHLSSNGRLLQILFVVSFVILFFILLSFRILFGTNTCSKTEIFPFDVGCPCNCATYRPDIPDTSNTTFYRFSVSWSLGDLDAYRNRSKTISRNSFHGNEHVARFFLETEQKVSSQVDNRVRNTGLPPLEKELQSTLHVSMSYMCCLTKPELDHARKTAEEWTKNKYDLRLRFNNMLCYHERKNSVTTTVVLDLRSQKKLLKINRDFNSMLRKQNVPVVITREHQMPFHSTLIGFHLRDTDDDISQYLHDIHNVVKKDNQIDLRGIINFEADVSSPNEECSVLKS